MLMTGRHPELFRDIVLGRDIRHQGMAPGIDEAALRVRYHIEKFFGGNPQVDEAPAEACVDRQSAI